MFTEQNRANTLSGIWFVSLFAFASMYIADTPFMRGMGISPLVVAIIFGMIYGNSLRHKLPNEWAPGVVFSSKNILRFAIVFYGFRVTYQQVFAVGMDALIIDAIIVIGTFLIGWQLGTRVFGLDRDSSMLIASGASICGAAAVIATEGTLKSEAHKVSMAVATVVIFGTIAMFLYPMLYNSGILGFDAKTYGIYVGSTVHEVAQAVVAGNAVGVEAGNTAVIVKMTRVMMLAPFLLALAFFLTRGAQKTGEKTKIMIPWFAVYFLVVVGFNSLNLLPTSAVDTINTIDTFLLAMAMAALGIETNLNKIKNVGMKPVYLALTLFAWLAFGGYALVRFVA
ncbi:MAG TPA: YeiH family protein [Campylobacterales bacterium]|nr:YeiH family protein [Campylobacterales bacterium]